MKYLRFVLILFIPFYFSSALQAQSDNYREALVTKRYGGATDITWDRDDHGNYAAKFKWKGKKYRADFGANGHWIETERSIKWDQLPKAVKRAVEKEYKEKDIAEIEWVEHPTKGIFYDVEIKKKGKNLDLEFTRKGERLN
ncbi:MAG: PepSY-like domain-containing protein [Bacteroidota bacterium]